MADSATRATLKQAYAQIKQGDKPAAIRLLKPLLRQDRDNATAWWLLANAVPKPEQAKQALEQVLRIRPGDEKAQKMLTRIEMGDRLSTPPEPAPPPAPDPFAVLDGAPVAPPSRRTRDSIDAAFEEDDPFAGVPPAGPLPVTSYSRTYDARAAGRTNQMFVYAIALVGVVLLLGLGGFLLASFAMEGNPGEARLATQGTCVVTQEEVGYMSENVVIDCGSIALDQRWNGEMSAYQSHDWFLEVGAGQSIRIDVRSPLDDTTLAVYGPDGAMIAENDDIDFGENTDSRLELTLTESGIYRVRVGMYFDSGGNYQIDVRDTGRVAAEDIASCANLRTRDEPGETIITCGDVRAGALINETLPYDGVHEWRLVAEPGQRISVEMNAMNDDLDPYLYIYRDDGTLLTSNDDIASFDNYDSRVSFVVPESGRVTISAEQFGIGGGLYRLTIRS